VATELNTERKTLSRRAVIDAALALGDKEGVEAVSLRRLARELGVTPMALYRYVDSKEGLLAAIADRAFEEFELPAEGEGDWREINEAGPKIQAVTAADVKRVANTYFTKENRAVAIYTRKPGMATQKEPAQEKQ